MTVSGTPSTNEALIAALRRDHFGVDETRPWCLKCGDDYPCKPSEAAEAVARAVSAEASLAAVRALIDPEANRAIYVVGNLRYYSAADIRRALGPGPLADEGDPT